MGLQSTADAGELDTIGRGEQQTINQNLLLEFVVYKGDTVYRPPDYEYRFIPRQQHQRHTGA